MAEIDELRAKLTSIRTKTQQIADNLNVPYTAGEMTLTEIGNLLEDIEEHGGGGGLLFSAMTSVIVETPIQVTSTASIADFAFSSAINTTISEAN